MLPRWYVNSVLAISNMPLYLFRNFFKVNIEYLAFNVFRFVYLNTHIKER